MSGAKAPPTRAESAADLAESRLPPGLAQRRILRWAVVASSAYLGVMMAWLALHLGGDRAVVVFGNFAELVPAVLAAPACAWAASRTVGRVRLVWALAGVAMLGWVVGQGIYTYTEVYLRQEPAFPGPPDLGYVVTALGLAGSIIALSWGLGGSRRAAADILDGVLVASSLVFVAWRFILRPIASAGGGWPVVAMSMAYPIIDVVIVTALVHALPRLTAERRRPATWLLAGAIMYALADAAYSWLIVQDLYVTGTWFTDVLWAGAPLCVGLGALEAGLRPAVAGPSPQALPRLRLWLPYILSVPAFVVIAMEMFTQDPDPFLDFAGVGWIVLVLARQFLHLRIQARTASALEETLEDRERLHGEVLRDRARLQAAVQRVEEIERATRRGTWEWSSVTGKAVLSPSLRAVLAVPPGFEATTENLVSLLHPDDRLGFEEAVAQAFLRPGTNAVDTRLRGPEGQDRWLRFEVVSSRGPTGEVDRVAGSVQDITDLKEMEAVRQTAHDQQKDIDLLSKVSAFKTSFINLAAHELRTPLTPIQLDLSTLRLHAKGLPPATSALVESLRRNIERLAGLTQELLDAAALQTSALLVHKVPSDPSVLVGEVVAEFEENARRKGVALQSTSSFEGEVEMDAGQIRKVLRQLVDNAVKFTPAGGKVAVVTARREGALEVAVQDTGVGLDSMQLLQLFRPFVQVHDSMQKTESGAGLGLYLSRAIVELHGGEIRASSPGPGKGATFTMRLPARAKPPAEPPSVASKPLGIPVDA